MNVHTATSDWDAPKANSESAGAAAAATAAATKTNKDNNWKNYNSSLQLMERMKRRHLWMLRLPTDTTIKK